MKRTREYRRSVAETHIAHKKNISRNIYFFDWYKHDNQYSKNKIFCSCSMCRGYNNYLEEMNLKSVKSEVESQIEESEEDKDYRIDLNIRIPNRFGRFRSHYSHGWK